MCGAVSPSLNMPGLIFTVMVFISVDFYDILPINSKVSMKYTCTPIVTM
jgi:hypothetical protein